MRFEENRNRMARGPEAIPGWTLKRNYSERLTMKAEFTAIIEPSPEGGYWAMCPEVPGANGQGETLEETKDNLRAAIEMLLEDRRADMLRGLPEDVIQDKVAIG